MTGTKTLHFPEKHITTAKARPAVLITLSNSMGNGEYCLEYAAAKALWADLGHAMRQMAKADKEAHP